MSKNIFLILFSWVKQMLVNINCFLYFNVTCTYNLYITRVTGKYHTNHESTPEKREIPWWGGIIETVNFTARRYASIILYDEVMCKQFFFVDGTNVCKRGPGRVSWNSDATVLYAPRRDRIFWYWDFYNFRLSFRLPSHV